MRRPPLNLPPVSPVANNSSTSNSDTTYEKQESEADPTISTTNENNQQQPTSSHEIPPTTSVLMHHHHHRPQLGHLHNTSSSNNNSSSIRPPLFSNIPSFAVTTMPGTSAHSRQKQEGNGPPPRTGTSGLSSISFPSSGQAFPQYTRDGTSNGDNNSNNFDKEKDQKLVDGFGQSDEGTMNFLLGSSSKYSSMGGQQKNTHCQNAAFEFFLKFDHRSPQQEEKSNANSTGTNQDSSSSSSSSSSSLQSFDNFFVRLWGPKYLFSSPQQSSAHGDDLANAEAVLSAVRQKILHRHHRLVILLHGAGMSSMCFHLVACQMLGIDPNENFIQIGEDDSVLMNPKSENGEIEKNVASSVNNGIVPGFVSASSQHNNNNSNAPQPIFVSFDYRCHGKTKMASENPPCDLDSLARDVTKIAQRMFGIGANLKQTLISSIVNGVNQDDGDGRNTSAFTSEKLFWAPDQSVCLVGHSVGGSLASAVSEIPEWRQKLFGLVLLDIVEGTALESIRHMPEFLKRRPRTFSSEAEAIQWFVRFGGMRDFESAKISVPTLLKKIDDQDGEDEKLNEDSATSPSKSTSPPRSNTNNNNNDNAFDDVLLAPSSKTSTATPNLLKKVEWITDLAKTEPFWNTWFHGMNGRFLRAICPRMLCLSSRDTLDKDLTVAHMQGQFQLEIFRDCGHYLMEDQPHMVGPVLMRFISRIEQQNEKLKAVYMKKFGVPTTSSTTQNNNNNSAGVVQGGGFPASAMMMMGHVVNPRANLGTPASTIPAFYTKK